MIKNNAVGEDTFTCKIKCPKCSIIITEATDIPESEKDIALLSLTSSIIVKSHLQECDQDQFNFEWFEIS